MKKLVACLMIVLFVLMAIAPAASAANQKGGVLGFFIGCCFGVRSGAAYNDGKDLHWREWGNLIPVFNLIVGIMNGVDGMNGLTTKDMAAKFGATYY